MRVGLDDRKAGISQPADVLEDFVARSHPLDFPVLAPTEPSDSPGARRVVRSNLSAKDLHIEGRLPPWLEPVEWQTNLNHSIKRRWCPCLCLWFEPNAGDRASWLVVGRRILVP